jgi:hypothetical protein
MLFFTLTLRYASRFCFQVLMAASLKMAFSRLWHCVLWLEFADDSEVLALMMEAAGISEASVNFYQTARHYNPEDNHLQVLFCLLSSPTLFLPVDHLFAPLL